VRLVLDTNTVLSGLLWQGNPGKLLDEARRDKVSLATTIALLAELRGVMAREKFARQLATRGLAVDDLFDGYSALATLVTEASIPATVLRDPPDDRVLAAALAAGADLIVSGDDDLLSMESFRGMPIVTAAEALDRLAAQSG